ncbi:hypothetical protein K470DRAFT_293184 [Piedraia hortae CBS 480.64]|uniref:MHD domain-containing protein n=1 Tax=Piedraia hortae CBS 480.64 TaxID=1314780 RepID=A0A6A7C6B4_9PEZI|nr:hypothetical protein K470DRAFT_293184 [Piedraia hortae CBS 480.64]
MDRTDYAALIPHQAVDVLDDRVRQIAKINDQVADWLQERRRLEEQYSDGLDRLAKRNLGEADLGIFSVPWTTLTNAAGTLAQAHSALASKIEVDVERPLRDFATSNPAMKAAVAEQSGLSVAAREKERKADQTHNRWDSQAPAAFEKLQVADEARLSHLRDVLTQLQTHEIDLVAKNQTTAEHCLNVLLSMQPEDEIKTFVIKTVQHPRPRSSRPPSSDPRPSRQPSIDPHHLFASFSNTDDASLRSAGAEDKRKSRFGGLKRLGTVVGKKKDKESKPFSLGRKGKKESALEPPSESRENAGSPERVLEPRSNLVEPEPQKDAEGFSIPPERGADPISQAQAQASAATRGKSEDNGAVSSLNQDGPTESHTPSQLFSDNHSRLSDDQPLGLLNVQIRDAPIPEEGSGMSLSSAAQRLPPPVVGRAGSSLRGRRAGRPVSTVNGLSSMPSGNPFGQPPEASPPREGTPSSALPALPTLGGLAMGSSALAMSGMASPSQMMPPPSPWADQHDNQSIRSGRSLSSSMTSQSRGHQQQHPDWHSTGLGVSIIETHHVKISNGETTQSLVTGDIGLASGNILSSEEATHFKLRSETQPLDKIITNPGLLNMSSDSVETEWSLRPVGLSRKPATAWRYQQARLSETPSLHFSLATKPERGQVSVIVRYTAPQQMQGGLKNLTVSLAVEGIGSHATQCQSKPQGAYSRERGVLYWTLGDTVPLGENKLLARFMFPDGVATEGAVPVVNARWEEDVSPHEVGMKVLRKLGKVNEDPFAEEENLYGCGNGTAQWEEVKGIAKRVNVVQVR